MNHKLFFLTAILAIATTGCEKQKNEPIPIHPSIPPSITFSTAKSKGEKIKLDIKANQTDRADVWIDLNGNGTKDAGEDVIFGEKEYTLGAQTITIYGKVTYLICGYFVLANPVLNKITALDVSKNTLLTHLDCQGNQLKNLNVSDNKVLTHLLCSNNQLMVLDISNNTKLTYLDCAANQLKKLDVSKNKALIDIYCQSNQLTAMDLSENKDLVYLNCRNNTIKSAAMDKLVGSLPLRDPKDNAYIEARGGENDFTDSHFALADSKKWKAD